MVSLFSLSLNTRLVDPAVSFLKIRPTAPLYFLKVRPAPWEVDINLTFPSTPPSLSGLLLFRPESIQNCSPGRHPSLSQPTKGETLVYMKIS